MIGQDKRTTFMIRNIPNKYTQVSCVCIKKEGGQRF